MADRLAVDGVHDARINAGAGNDVLTGGAMLNVLAGGTGDDTYVIKDLDDLVIELPGEGIDKVTSSVDYALTANVEGLRLIDGAYAGTGNALDNGITGNALHNELSGLAGNDTIYGREGNDHLIGGDGDDYLVGDTGNDWIEGGTGTDRLYGGDGNDSLIGGDGNDMVQGDKGADRLIGGDGADTFLYGPYDFSVDLAASTDHIRDFSRAQGDRISLTSIDANALTTSINDKFSFIGTGAFHNQAGELRYQVIDGSAHVMGDVNGDGKADFDIVLDRVTALQASDFYL